MARELGGSGQRPAKSLSPAPTPTAPTVSTADSGAADAAVDDSPESKALAFGPASRVSGAVLVGGDPQTPAALAEPRASSGQAASGQVGNGRAANAQAGGPPGPAYRTRARVPRDARDEPPSRWARFIRRFGPPRRLKFTREGKYYIGITIGVGFAAINTGNNLLYLLLGMLLSLVVVSGVMSDLSLRRLTVTRRLPVRAQVGRAHLVEIEVYNHKKRVPSYAIEVEDLRAGQPADKRCFFLKISPLSAQVAAYRRTPARRGRDRHTGFRIATRFPFGLFEKSREVEAEGELIIYPAVDPVRLPAEDPGRRAGGAMANGRGAGDETFALRPMREGDDPRDVYWRKSTIPDQLILRERARETRPDVELVVDSLKPRALRPADGEAFVQQMERRIREVASRSVAHIKRGDSVMVRSTTGDRVRGDKNLGADPILRFLALLDWIEDDAPAPALPVPVAEGSLSSSGGSAPSTRASGAQTRRRVAKDDDRPGSGGSAA